MVCLLVATFYRCHSGFGPPMDLDPPAPASSRGQKISMILIFAPLIDQISVPVLGGVVVSLVDA